MTLGRNWSPDLIPILLLIMINFHVNYSLFLKKCIVVNSQGKNILWLVLKCLKILKN